MFLPNGISFRPTASRVHESDRYTQRDRPCAIKSVAISVIADGSSDIGQ